MRDLPDVSFWQDNNSTPNGIDFAKMRLQCDDVIIRAGQRNWPDQDFSTNWAAARLAGLKRGSYWFYDSRESPASQAGIWRSLIGSDMPERGLWIDLEESYNGSYKGEANWKRFAETVRTSFPGVQIGIYTANWWWVNQATFLDDYWASFPLWVAGYNGPPAIPRPWRLKGYVLHQYTDHGDGPAYGVESLNIDLNHATPEFYNLFGEQPPQEDPTMAQYITGTTTAADSAGGLQVRAEPSTAGARLGSLPFGTRVEGWLEAGWIKIVFQNRPAYISAGWVTYTIVIPPPSSGGEVVDVTMVERDDSGSVVATWSGTLTKQ